MFTILMCGKRSMMDRLRRLIPPAPDVRLAFTSSPGFLAGRALFAEPKLVLIDVSREPASLRADLGEFTGEYPEIPILAVTTAPGRGSAAELEEAGIFSCFRFPEEHQKISDQINRWFDNWRSGQTKQRYVAIQQDGFDFSQIVGQSDALRTTIGHARTVIRNHTLTVLITGETGTGKELFARAIHFNGKTKAEPFVDIGCSALPETLLESELFGHERGAFTDAKEKKIGLFEIAGDGTIFLDEIGDISLSTQSKLLKVIEDRTMRRVGGVQDIPVRARIIAATSADLDAKMKSGEFRKDLYHRLKILPLELPPLRERVDDIPLLVNQFLSMYNKMYGKQIRGLTHHAMQVLMDHNWEGNVRELRHAIERAVLLEEGSEISEKGFELIPREPETAGRRVLANSGIGDIPHQEDTLVMMMPFNNASIREMQLLLVRKVLEHVGGNKLRASRMLKISRPRLDRILKSAQEEEENPM